MNSIQNYYIQSQLAQGAYADLFPGIDKNTYAQSLRDIQMSESQIGNFMDQWQVVDTYTDFTGVSATVFENKDSHERYLAVRGTELGALDLTADFILALGFPTFLNPQFVGLSAQVGEWIDDGTLPNGFTVAGHSSGGYLAAGIAAQYHDNVSDTYTFNAPGIGGPAGDIFDLFKTALGLGDEALLSDLHNFRGSAGFIRMRVSPC